MTTDTHRTEDLVTRLRNYGNAVPGTLSGARPFSMTLEAATEIERLRGELKEARRCKHTNRNGTGSISSDGKIVTSELYCTDCGEKLT